MHKTLLRPEPQETKRFACVKKVWGPQRPTQAKVGLIPAPVKRLRELREGQKRSWEVPLGLGCGQGQDQGPEISEIGLLSRPPALQPPWESELLLSQERNVAGILALSNSSLS